MKRIATVAALGLLAVAAPVLMGLGGDADAEHHDNAPQPPREAETIEIGETEDLDVDMVSLADGEQVFTYPDATYVKMHFSRLTLADGDYVTVSDVEGDQVHRYESALGELWATSISGDTAVVKLHKADGKVNDATSDLGVKIDKVAKGIPAPEVAEREEAKPHPESVCGDDDQRDAVCYRDGEPEIYANSAPVARLLIDGTTLCTAWRVGEQNRLLTNNHCFSSDKAASDTEVWFNYACASCGGEETSSTVKVKGDDVIATDETYDFTLFTVDDFDAIKDFGYLTLADRAPKDAEKLYIPQHPNGSPSQIALDSDEDSGGKCQVDSASYDGYATGSDASYYCDTAFGSSGSPVLSRETHEVVALHHFGGCPNAGVRADKIVERIGEHI
ncbi:MAG: trypsin-like serine peptidase [Stackebrandtia sp.]